MSTIKGFWIKSHCQHQNLLLLQLSLNAKKDSYEIFQNISLSFSHLHSFYLLAVAEYLSILGQREAALESNPLSLCALLPSLNCSPHNLHLSRIYMHPFIFMYMYVCVCRVGEPVHNLISLANKATHLLLFTSVINSTSFQASSAINKLPLWEPENIVNS